MKQDEELKNISNWDLLKLYTQDSHLSESGLETKHDVSVLWDEIQNRMEHGITKWREIRK